MRSLQGQRGGFIVATELLLIALILVIGLTVGLQAVRVAVVTELADLGAAIGSLSQTYSFSGVAGHHASANGSLWQDGRDTCDGLPGGQGLAATARCVRICGVGALDPGIPDEMAAPENAPPAGASVGI